MLDSGDPAPDFDLRGTAGDDFAPYRLSAAANQAPVLVAFYAENFALRCRAYLEALRDTDWGSLTDAIAVFGVAPGDPDDHRAFATELDLRFPLLVDHAGIAGQFGVAGPDGRPRRTAFLVDGRCRVRATWVDESDEETAPDIGPLRTAVAELDPA